MKSFKIALVAFAGLVSVSAFAECGGKVVFQCDTTKGKVVEVCETPTTVNYAFGKKGAAPELFLKQVKSKTTVQRWAGFGSYETHGVSFQKGAYDYTVRTAFDHREKTNQAGVIVTADGQGQIADVQCKRINVNKIYEINGTKIEKQ